MKFIISALITAYLMRKHGIIEIFIAIIVVWGFYCCCLSNEGGKRIMQKSILVVDTPISCRDCIARSASDDCQVTCKSVAEYRYNKSKPEWCPLREYTGEEKEAREKQRAKKVKNRKLLKDAHVYYVCGDCPNCGNIGLLSIDTDYCNVCGQRLDWSDIS